MPSTGLQGTLNDSFPQSSTAATGRTQSVTDEQLKDLTPRLSQFKHLTPQRSRA